MGPGWRARFETNGWSFAPAMEVISEAPVVPLALELLSIGRDGGDPIELAREVVPERHGDVIRYDRGDVFEEYEIVSEGVEQSFHLRSLPDGQGDLVVRLRLETTFALDVSPGGAVLRYEDLGGIDIGGVTAIDGAGRRAKGSLRATGPILELVVPSSFLDEVTLPLVVDPFYSPSIPFPAATTKPKVFFDETSGNYLITFGQPFTGGLVDLTYRVLYSDDTLSPWSFVSTQEFWTPDDSADAVQSTSYTNGAFILAFTEEAGLPSNDRWLYLIAIDATTGTSTGYTWIEGDFRDPDVWGVGTVLGAGGATIVYQEVSVGVRARTVRLETDGSLSTSGGFPTLGAITIGPDGANPARHPRISRSAPFEVAPSIYGKAMVLWEVDGFHRARLLGAAETPVDLGSAFQFFLNETRSARIDGDGHEFYFAYELSTGDHYMYGFEVQPDNSVVNLAGSYFEYGGFYPIDDSFDVCHIGPFVGVVYDSGNSVCLMLRDHETLDEGPFGGIGTHSGNPVDSPHIATDHPSDGGSVQHGGVIAYRAGSTALVRRFRNYDGLVLEVAPACGVATLELVGGLPGVGNSDFALQVVDPAPFGSGIPLLNFLPGPPQLFPCGPCTLALGPGTLYVEPTGRFEFPIPLDAGLVGFRGTAAGGILVPPGGTGGGCSIASRLLFTNILDMTIQN